MPRRSKGRQKVEMVKMCKESNLQVTFSKRRSGLFKKASELCTLCAVEIVIIVFSPGKKVFSFGHPYVESLIERFLTRTTQLKMSGTLQLIEAHRNANVRELNAELMQVMSELERERKRGEEMKIIWKASLEGQNCWWEAPINDLEMGKLEQLRVSLEELKKNVAKQKEMILIQTSNPPQYFAAVNSINNNPPSHGALPFDPHINHDFNLSNVNVMPHAYNNKIGYGRGFY